MGRIYTCAYPNEEYRFSFYANFQKKSWQEIVKETGAHLAVPLPYFLLTGYAKAKKGCGIEGLNFQSNLMYQGEWVCGPAYDEPGVCIDSNGHLTLAPYGEAKDLYEYTCGLPCCWWNGKKHYGYKEYGRNGATFVGITDSGVVWVLLSPKDNTSTYGCTTAQAVATLRNEGCATICRFDGSWSTQGYLRGTEVQPPQTRICPMYLIAVPRKTQSEDDEKEGENVSVTGMYQVTAGSGLRFRDKPTTASSSKILGVMAYGTKVNITKVQNGWGQHSKGWSSMEYLKKVSDPPAVTKPEVPKVEEACPVPLTVKVLTQNRCYQNGYKRDKTKGMLHSTGTPGAVAATFASSWNTSSASVAVEFVIDDKDTFQLLPVYPNGIKSWHGAGDSNDLYWAMEICEPWECKLIPINWYTQGVGSRYNNSFCIKRIQQELNILGFYNGAIDGKFSYTLETSVKRYQKSVGLYQDGKVGRTTLQYMQKRVGSFMRYNPDNAREYFETVYTKAVLIFAWMFKKSGTDPTVNNNCVCHSEGYKLGIASNHADVMHWFPYHGKTMDDFRKDVKLAMEGKYGETLDKPSELDLACDLLAQTGIINSPEYWKQGAYSAANVQELLKKFAKHMQEHK